MWVVLTAVTARRFLECEALEEGLGLPLVAFIQDANWCEAGVPIDDARNRVDRFLLLWQKDGPADFAPLRPRPLLGTVGPRLERLPGQLRHWVSVVGREEVF